MNKSILKIVKFDFEDVSHKEDNFQSKKTDFFSDSIKSEKKYPFIATK